MATVPRRQDESEACRIKAIREFMDRRRSDGESGCLPVSSSDEESKFKTFVKKNNKNKKDENCIIPGVPHIKFSELFEIGWVAGTEDRYLEYIYAEWDNTKVSLKKCTHPECENAIKADLAILTEIRHPNIALLIATTYLKDHGLVSIFESLNCTLYNYVHEKGERISVQEVSRCARKLAEALGFAHMRGFIHGAISSHCVFLASGVIKLGGWELTTKKNQPKAEREFETLLRSEIFRWQAPEIFSNNPPSEATDVYGLSLLIWEMTTMHLPWSGLSRAEVERQYINWKQGVSIDPYHFPPLLSKLLEAGLEIDVAKRSLTINRMRRFLQRLELQYETETPIYANEYTNNNINPNSKSFTVSDSTSPIRKSHPTPIFFENGKPASKNLFSSQKKICNKVTRSTSKRDLADKDSAKPKIIDKNPSLKDKINTTLFLDKERLHKNVINYKVFQPTLRNVEQCTEEAEVQVSSNQNSAVEEINSSSEECISSLYDGSISTQTLESCDEDEFNDTRNNIKKLRETLASKRERFFYGDDFQSSTAETTLGDKNSVLDQVRSKDYEPHKPASHKTSLEPKLNKSLQYDTLVNKPARDQQQKSNHSSIPSEIKEAVFNPQLLSANYRNIFESSLWRREKLICISKMRKGYTEENMDTYPEYLKLEKSTSHQKYLKPVEKNETFIMNDVSDQTLDKDSTLRSDMVSQDSGSSLIALREALDRATHIIRPSSPVAEDSRHSSPAKTLEDNFEIPTEDIETREALFENVIASKIGAADPNSRIKSIERITSEENPSPICQNTYRIKKRPKNVLESSELITQCVGDSESLVNHVEEKNGEDDMISILLRNKNQDSVYNSCDKETILSRRRSLPAALGQLKAHSRMSIGKLPILKADHSNNTVEDLYIDDDFCDNLNVNMVLLENDNPDEEDILPALLELSQLSLFDR